MENKYSKFFLNYGLVSEIETLQVIDSLPKTKVDGYDEGLHFDIITSITDCCFKLKYEKVKDRLREMFPLSFPNIELSYISGFDLNKEGACEEADAFYINSPTPPTPAKQTKEDKLRVEKANEFVKNLFKE